MIRDRHREAAALLQASGWRFYAITTSDRPDRMRRLQGEFERAAIPVDILVTDKPSDSNGFANRGTWGCFSAHLQCLRKARDEGAVVAVMAEDDVVLTRLTHRHLPAVVRQLAQVDWSMLYLGYLRESPATGDGLDVLTDNVARLRGWEVRGTHLYAVHASALDALIDDFESRLSPGGHRISADGVLNEFRRDNSLDTLVCVPNLAHQAPSPSGISVASTRVHRAKAAVLGHGGVQRLFESVKRVGTPRRAPAVVGAASTGAPRLTAPSVGRPGRSSGSFDLRRSTGRRPAPRYCAEFRRTTGWMCPCRTTTTSPTSSLPVTMSSPCRSLPPPCRSAGPRPTPADCTSRSSTAASQPATGSGSASRSSATAPP
jgi:GR25 family glycosyltransferase involved in LPS biosynthesis